MTSLAGGEIGLLRHLFLARQAKDPTLAGKALDVEAELAHWQSRGALRVDEGKIVEVDVRPMTGANQEEDHLYLDERPLERLENVAVLTLGGASFTKLDLGALGHLRHLRLAGCKRGLAVDVSSSTALRELTVLPYDAAIDEGTTDIVCHSSQIAAKKKGFIARDLEKKHRNAEGYLTIRVTPIDAQKRAQVPLAWCLRHPDVDLGVILEAYWLMQPAYYAKWKAEADIDTSDDDRRAYRVVREAERLVAAGFFTRRKVPFDMAKTRASLYLTDEEVGSVPEIMTKGVEGAA